MTVAIRPPRFRTRTAFLLSLPVGLTAIVAAFVAGTGTPASSSSPGLVSLGAAGSFAVLAGTTVTNAHQTTIEGDVGVSAGSAITGFPPGIVVPATGALHAADGLAADAQTGLTAAYIDLQGRASDDTVTGGQLGGLTLGPGVYTSASQLLLTGTLVLDGQNTTDPVFIFQAGSDLITASGATVELIGGADPCNIFWQVGSSATVETGTTFAGSVLALTSATVNSGAIVAGRVLARNGQVSLDTATITAPSCAGPSPSPSPSPSASPSASASTSPSPSSSPSPADTPAPTATASPRGSSSATASPVAAAHSTASTMTGTGSRAGNNLPVVPAGHPETGAGGAAASPRGGRPATGGRSWQ